MAPNRLSREWLRDLPKCELHLHLEGTISPATLVRLSQRHDPAPLDLLSAAAIYRYRDFAGFLNSFSEVTKRLQAAADYGLVAAAMMDKLVEQGIRHAEVYISYGDSVRQRNLSLFDILAAVEEARHVAEEKHGLSVLWVLDLVRSNGIEHAQFAANEAIRLNKSFPNLVGVGLGGDEVNFPAEMFRNSMKTALDAGLRVKIHAGEASPAWSIRQAISIGAQRIGHAFTAIQDQDLMRDLKELQLPLEICITSNLRTGCLVNLQDHPIRRYMDAGLSITLGSDDPALFRADLLDEFELLNRELGFTKEELIRIARNSIEGSFLDSKRKAVLLGDLEAYS